MVLTGKGRDHEGVKGLIRMETQTQADVDGGKVKIDDQTLQWKERTVLLCMFHRVRIY